MSDAIQGEVIPWVPYSGYAVRAMVVTWMDGLAKELAAQSAGLWGTKVGLLLRSGGSASAMC